MRALSENMTVHQQFLSTPKFISDLLYISDVLITVENDKRNKYLGEMIKEINKNLPNNVYVPIESSNRR